MNFEHMIDMKKNALNKYCNGKIKRIFITSRSTFFCKKCQK